MSLKKTLSFERTLEVIKIDIYSCCVSHSNFISLLTYEIFGFVWYVNNSTAYVTLKVSVTTEYFYKIQNNSNSEDWNHFYFYVSTRLQSSFLVITASQSKRRNKNVYQSSELPLFCILYVTLHDFLGNQEYHWSCRTKSLKTVHVCVCTH